MSVEEQDSSKIDHRAHIGCYVRDLNTDKVYGVTNKHVVLHAKSRVYIKPDGQTRLSFGVPLPSVTEDSQDVGLIEINDNFDTKVCNQITDQLGRRRMLALFKGRKEEIYGNRVFKCTSEIARLNYKQCEDALYGMIPAFEDPLAEDDTDLTFSVKDKHFSRPGDSGTAVALDKANTDDGTGDVEVIGMISGGFEDRTLCMYLPTVIEELNATYDMDLQLLVMSESVADDTSIVDESQEHVQHTGHIDGGVTIFFLLKTPEKISPYSFDLTKQTVILAGLRFDEVVKLSKNHLEILKHGKELNRLVNLREPLDHYSIFENDNPDYKALEQGLMAVECLHSGKFKDVELKLKIAVSCIPKCQTLALWLFAKNYTYIMWFYILQNTVTSRQSLKVLINEGIDFYEDNKDCMGFPKETGAYPYFELSRYYIQQYDIQRLVEHRDATEEASIRSKSIEHVRKAVQIMKEAHASTQTQHSLVRQSTMQCELAFALLGCGNKFGVCGEDTMITDSDISEAEDIMQRVTSDVVKPGFIEEHIIKHVIYLVTLCDLKFRKGCFEEALSVATKCLSKAQQKKDILGIARSEKELKS